MTTERKTRSDKKYTDEYLEALADKLIAWVDIDGNYWLGKFAAENKLWGTRLGEFAKANEYFRDAMCYAKQVQENKLVHIGLTDKVACAMAIFALKNVAGWRDKQEVAEDEEIKNHDIEISGVPKNGDGRERFKRFLN